MVTAAIVINQSGKSVGLPSTSRDDLDLGVLVTLSNNDNTGVVSWLWEYISKPPGSTATLSTPTSSTSSFTPDLRGSYLIKLTVTDGGAGSDIDKRIAAVKTSYLGIRVPAVQETTEFDLSFGWADALYDALIAIDSDSSINLKVDGSSLPTANISLNSKRITNLQDPGSSQDAATRNYVDTNTASHAIGGTKHNASTLVELNAKISDATLDGVGSSRPPSGTASGDLTGTYPSPTVFKIRGITVDAGSPINNQVLIYNSSSSEIEWQFISLADGYNVKVSSNDILPGFLDAKLVEGLNVVFTENNDGGNETLTIATDGYLKLEEQSGDPANSSNIGILYAKEVSGYTELFYINDNGDVAQLTQGGSVGTSLNTAYNIGRTITVNAGAVELAQAGTTALRISGNPSGVNSDGIRVQWASGANAANQSGIYLDIEANGENNVSAIYAKVQSLGAALSAGEQISAFKTHFDLDGSDSPVSEIVALQANASVSTLGQYIGVNLINGTGRWTTALRAETGDILLRDGYLLLGEISDPSSPPDDAGFLYVKNDIGNDSELFYMDNRGNAVQITKNGAVNSSDGYSGGGGLVDGYLFMEERTSDPSPVIEDAGFLYAKDVSGFTELFYMDNYGTVFQLSSTDSTDYVALHQLLSSPTSDVNELDGYLYGLKTNEITELYFMDNYGTITQITNNGVLDISDAYAEKTLLDGYVQNLGQAYDGGRNITADSGPVVINASGNASLQLDGYLVLDEITNPNFLGNSGILYVKNDVSDSELYYMDNSGNIVQITKDGELNVVGGGGGTGLTDGYLSMPERGSDPSYHDNYGAIYTKDVNGYTELFFIDNYGSATQITDDGELNVVGGGGTGLTDGYLPMPERGSDPSYHDDYGAIYTKDADGYTELFFIDNYGSVTQITDDGYVNATDNDAIHIDVDNEISSITEKSSPTISDLVVIEDAADGYSKKSVELGNILINITDNTYYPGFYNSCSLTSGSNQTVGLKMFFVRVGTMIGIRFRTIDTGTITFRGKLWNNTSEVASGTLETSAAGVYDITFSTPYSITETMLGNTFYISLYDTTNGEVTWQSGNPPNNMYKIGIGWAATDGIPRSYRNGDDSSAPTSDATTGRYPVGPIYRITNL